MLGKKTEFAKSAQIVVTAKNLGLTIFYETSQV